MVDKNTTQKCDAQKTYPAVLWFDKSNGFCHFITITCIVIPTFYDILKSEIREHFKKMDFVLDSSSLCHVHENDLDTACLDILLPLHSNHKNRYELFGQTSECQGCPLLSMVDNVENGTRVKIDTRYGGVTSLSLLEHNESR